MSGLTYDEKLPYVSPVAQPMADRRLAKRLVKLIGKAMKEKKVCISAKQIPKFILKGKKTGIVILAGDAGPIESFCHMPIICEEKEIPYCYIASKDELSAACQTVADVHMLLVEDSKEYSTLFEKCHKKVNALPLPVT